MTWKPIPHEAPAKDPGKKTHISPRFKKHPVYKKKNYKHPKTSYRLFQSVSMRLLDYVKKESKCSLQEVADLITDMQRTIANLQKKRMKLYEEKKDKLTKKKTKTPRFKIKRIK